MYFKYNIERKEISLDRGVTWQETTETRYKVVGTYKTLRQCENTDCELEKYDILLVDEQKNGSICSKANSSYNKVLPSGIASVVRFTSGMYCCVDTWGSSDNKIIDEYHNAEWITQTATVTSGWNAVRQYNTFKLAGREMQTRGFCGQQTCYNITKWMPWVENLDTLKTLYLVKYIRQHCSDEWQIDETVEPERIGFGERWVKTYEDFYKATWQHQIATGITTTSVPYVVSWEDDGEPFDQTFDVSLPEGLELIPEIRNDGIASNRANSMLNKAQIKIALNGNASGDVTSRKYAYSSDVEGCDWYVSTYQGGGGLDSTCNYDYHSLANDYTTCNLTPYPRANYASLFAGLNITRQSGQYYITLVDKLNNTRSGEIILFDEYPMGMAFPYKIPADYGYQDSYDNASEYGYIFRDGRRIILEYKNSSGTKRSGDNPFNN